MRERKRERKRERGGAAMGSRMPPLLTDQLHYLVSRANIPPFQIENIRKGHAKSRYADRFTLIVPCCFSHVRWDVIYNCQYPWLAPDVIFSAEDEGFQPLIALESSDGTPSKISTILKDWNVKDPSSLLALIMELRNLYLQYQRKLVEELDDPRLKFEISTITNMKGIEMCIVPGIEKEVKFVIPMAQVDLSHLLFLSAGKRQRTIYMQINFPIRKVPGAVPVIPQLKLVVPPSFKEFFDVDDVKPAVWSDRMCLAEYIPTMQEMLKCQVHEAFASIVHRRGFIEALFMPFGRPLEADTIYCRRASVLVSSGMFLFLVHFSLPILFPKQQPTLMLQSCQHFDISGKPIVRQYKDFPWSPRWSSAEMVHRICDFVVDECNHFKKYCQDVLQHRSLS